MHCIRVCVVSQMQMHKTCWWCSLASKAIWITKDFHKASFIDTFTFTIQCCLWLFSVWAWKQAVFALQYFALWLKKQRVSEISWVLNYNDSVVYRLFYHFYCQLWIQCWVHCKFRNFTQHSPQKTGEDQKDISKNMTFESWAVSNSVSMQCKFKLSHYSA